MCASTLWPFSRSTRNIALGNGSTTVPSTRIVSSLGFATVHHQGPGRAEEHAEEHGAAGQTSRATPEKKLRYWVSLRLAGLLREFGGLGRRRRFSGAQG